MTHSLLLEVPESIYQPIVEEAKGRKVEEIALERLASGNPKMQLRQILFRLDNRALLVASFQALK